MTQDSIRKLVADSVTSALEAQAATMASASNPRQEHQSYWKSCILCPNMVPNNEKLLEAFIGGLPRSIEGNVTASKPQTLEEAINIAQRLMDQVTKHTPMQVSGDNKRSLMTDELTTTALCTITIYRNTNNRYKQSSTTKPKRKKLFWATAKVKTVNDVRQIQALIDKKKLIITETSIRSDLHLEDAGDAFKLLRSGWGFRPSNDSNQLPIVDQTISTSYQPSRNKSIRGNKGTKQKIAHDEIRAMRFLSGKAKLHKLLRLWSHEEGGDFEDIDADVDGVEGVTAAKIDELTLAQTLIEIKVNQEHHRISQGQKLGDDKDTNEHEEVEADDTAELKKNLVFKKDDDIAIDAIHLVDGSSKRYSSMIRMLQDIDREDLETLWKLVKTKHGSSTSSDSEVDSCSKTCVKAYATLKEQYYSLSSDYKKSQFNLVSYKAGLESVEARLAHYKKNEAVFEESINVLKLEVRLRDNALNEYKMNLEKAKKEKDQLKQTLEKFKIWREQGVKEGSEDTSQITT
ncbi:hypothetical protein Tco_0466221 [Tanacetum coccineum]